MADSTSFPRWFQCLLDRFFPVPGWPEDPFERQIVGRVPPRVEGDTVTETVWLACGHKLDLVYRRIRRVNCAQCAAGLPAGDAAAATGELE